MTLLFAISSMKTANDKIDYSFPYLFVRSLIPANFLIFHLTFYFEIGTGMAVDRVG